jgi:hypothetical protein
MAVFLLVGAIVRDRDRFAQSQKYGLEQGTVDIRKFYLGN